MQTKLYRRQHGDIRRLLHEAARNLVPLDPDACRSTLAKLAGMLKIHMTMEDHALYPRLLTHDNPSVRQTASDYQQSMGQLGPAFEGFFAKWSAHGAIEAEPAQYAAGQRVIAQALKQRMDLEDTNLYDLVDEHADLAS